MIKYYRCGSSYFNWFGIIKLVPRDWRIWWDIESYSSPIERLWLIVSIIKLFAGNICISLLKPILKLCESQKNSLRTIHKALVYTCLIGIKATVLYQPPNEAIIRRAVMVWARDFVVYMDRYLISSINITYEKYMIYGHCYIHGIPNDLTSTIIIMVP